MNATNDPDIARVSQISSIPTLLRVVSEVSGLRLALVARVTDDDWKACAVLDRMEFGLKAGDHLDVSTTLCKEVRSARQTIAIEHASADAQYCNHPTPKMYRFESYISTPIVLEDGSYFGNLCVLDSAPATFQEGRAIPMMALFAELIGRQLTAEAKQEETTLALLDAQETAELREQFIAVLGHDIRTPLSAIVTGAGLLARVVGPKEREFADRIKSSARRITKMADDLADFARGRLGGGMELSPEDEPDLGALLEPVIAELRQAHPTRTIAVSVGPMQTVCCDSQRLGQAVSNLVANAIEHGTEGTPVKVEWACEGDRFVLDVHNEGEPIAESFLPRIFEPYKRAKKPGKLTGLGLGLYIAAQIVEAHKGTLTVRSTRDEGTTFTLSIPRAAQGIPNPS